MYSAFGLSGCGKSGSRDRIFIRPKLGHFEIDSLTAEQLQLWHASLGKAPRHARSWNGTTKEIPLRSGEDGQRARRASANRTLTTLRASLNRVWRAGKVGSDRAWRSVEPFENVDAARVRYLTVSEAKLVIVVPIIRTTAFACRYKNKPCLNDFRMCHRRLALLLAPLDF